jgi:hypothetical protein
VGQFDGWVACGRGDRRHALPTTKVNHNSPAPRAAARRIEVKNGAPCVVKMEPTKIQRTIVGRIARSIKTRSVNASSSQRRRTWRAYRACPISVDRLRRRSDWSYALGMARRSRLEPVASSPVARRLLGVPPTPGASHEERLRYVRRCTMLSLSAVALLWIVVLGFGHDPTWLLIVMGASTVLGLESAASLSWRIRRTCSQSSDRSADPN